MRGKTDWSFFALLAWGIFAVTTFFSIHILTVTQAGAVSLRVKLACRSDYFAHCSMYSPGSQEVRRCMRKVGKKLSDTCLNALVAAGEVSGREVASRR